MEWNECVFLCTVSDDTTKWMCSKIRENKMRGAKKRAWWLDECLAKDHHSLYTLRFIPILIRYILKTGQKTLSPFFATPASTTIAGIVSSKGTLSSSDLCSSLSFYKKQLKKPHRISQEQDPVQASSPTSTQRRPIMSTDQPYLKHNLHVKILRNEKPS